MTTWDEVIAACEANLARWSRMPVDAGEPVKAMVAPRTAPSPEQRRRLADLLDRTATARGETAARLAGVADELEALRERRRARRAYSGDGAA